MSSEWLLPGAKQDGPTVDADWCPVDQPCIAGVRIKEIRNVPTGYGWLSEVWRGDWALDELPVDQVFQSTLALGGVSAWHAHAETTDRIFVNHGMIRLVLYDARRDSPTFGLVQPVLSGMLRPRLIVVPPRVWHGVQNVHDRPSSLLNLVDRAYRYESPDHWRLPPDTPEIPYRFMARPTSSELW
jgi:dTDP-4-dehydrorhamnose 3,5-epimerase